eukprot:4188214-Amphidinium_carterae.1
MSCVVGGGALEVSICCRSCKMDLALVALLGSERLVTSLRGPAHPFSRQESRPKERLPRVTVVRDKHGSSGEYDREEGAARVQGALSIRSRQRCPKVKSEVVKEKPRTHVENEDMEFVAMVVDEFMDD